MQKKILAILLIGLVAGTMDITAAIIQYSIKTGKCNPIPVLRYVASGLLGKEAFIPGKENLMIVYGLLFHYSIALLFTIIYVTLYSLMPFLQKAPVLCGILYGLIVWVIMNRLVVPLSQAPPLPFTWKGALIAAAILITCIGLPIALLTKRWVRQ